MNTSTLSGPPGSGPVLPALPLAPARRLDLARLKDLSDGILFWGILGLGALLPFAGALYALLRG